MWFIGLIARSYFWNLAQTFSNGCRRKNILSPAILVWKLSRFARNREDSIIYKSLLKRHGVQVISINEPLEDTPTGRMLEGMIEVIDEFYSSNLAQEVTRGMREAASRGFWVSGWWFVVEVHAIFSILPQLAVF